MAGDDFGSSTLIGLAERVADDPGLSKDLSDICKRVSASHGFYGYVNALRVKIPGCNTYPTDWRACYYEEGYHTLDPLISALNGSRRATYLDDLKQIPAFQRIWMEHAAEFGIDPPQIGVPMFGPHGETAIFLVHAKEAPKYDYERNKLLRKVMSRAVEFHDSVMTSYDMAAILGVPSLTEREKFCLYQAAIGQGTSVIAQLGGISDRTVETHLKTCREKLEAKTTVHAVAIAVYKGIIQPELPEEAPSALIGAPKI